MNYSKINYHDIANGPGVRVSLFVSGCRRHCPGCFNKATWEFNAGRPFTMETEDAILEALGSEYVSGLSLLGGDPFEPENTEALLPFLARVRNAYPDKTIWCWTGFVLEELKSPKAIEMLGMVDCLVDGPFVLEEKQLGLKWRGSRNQRVIPLNKSIGVF